MEAYYSGDLSPLPQASLEGKWIGSGMEVGCGVSCRLSSPFLLRLSLLDPTPAQAAPDRKF